MKLFEIIELLYIKIIMYLFCGFMSVILEVVVRVIFFEEVKGVNFCFLYLRVVMGKVYDLGLEN